MACLWVLNLDTGTERLLADPADLLRDSAQTPSGEEGFQPERTPEGSGIAAYATDLAGGLVAFALADWLWTVDVAGGRVRRLPAEGPVVDPRPDPAGRRIAYLSGGAFA